MKLFVMEVKNFLFGKEKSTIYVIVCFGRRCYFPCFSQGSTPRNIFLVLAKDQHLVIALVDMNGGANNVKIISVQKRRPIFCSGRAEKKFTFLFFQDLLFCRIYNGLVCRSLEELGSSTSSFIFLFFFQTSFSA